MSAGASSSGPVSPYVRFGLLRRATTTAPPHRRSGEAIASRFWFFAFFLYFSIIFFFSASLSVARSDVRLCFATSTRRHVVGVTVRRRRHNTNVEPPLLRVGDWVTASASKTSAFACASSCCLLRPCAVRRISAFKTATGAFLNRCVWVPVPNLRVVGLHDRLH